MPEVNIQSVDVPYTSSYTVPPSSVGGARPFAGHVVFRRRYRVLQFLVESLALVAAWLLTFELRLALNGVLEQALSRQALALAAPPGSAILALWVLVSAYRGTYRRIRGEEPDKDYLGNLDCRAEAQLAFLRRHSPTQLSRARILDVGCSAGSFLKACAGFTQSLTGFEPDDTMRTAARKRLPPAAVLHGTLFQAERLAGQAFDVIVASHVLEHVPQPRFFLSALCGSLSGRGALLIEVPNEDSATVGNWIQSGERGRMHLFFFTPRTLRDIIEAAGGRVVHLATFGARKDDSSLIAGDAAALKARLKSFVETSFGPAALGSARRLWKAWRGRARRRLMGIERGLSGEYLRVVVQKKLH